jgi:hypothetical protein
VNVPFAFVAQDQNCPAGIYTFSRGQMQAIVAMRSADGKISVQLPVVTALARSSDKDDHLLAFDKVEDKRVLSEVWLPDRDGALVHITPADHTHEIIRKASGGGGTR